MTGRERLALLAERLREPLPAGTIFNMGVWRVERDCGTVACAVGLAMAMPEFQAEGLSARSEMRTPGYFSPLIHPGYTSMAAVTEFFRLPFLEADFLFSPDSYERRSDTTPGEVADRIDASLAGELKAPDKPGWTPR